MKATEQIKHGKGLITFIDETGKHASFTREVDEIDPAKLKKLAKDEERRVTDLYACYENVTWQLLGKPINLTKAKK